MGHILAHTCPLRPATSEFGVKRIQMPTSVRNALTSPLTTGTSVAVWPLLLVRGATRNGPAFRASTALDLGAASTRERTEGKP
jgi:hypothetical protein